MLMQSSGIQLTTDIKKQKLNTGYSLLSESHPIPLLDYKTVLQYILQDNIKTRCQSILSFLSLYRFLLKLFSNNLILMTTSINQFRFFIK